MTSSGHLPYAPLTPEMADFFFVPSYACCHQVAGIADFDELDTEHKALVSQLAYFERSRGRDHIFLLSLHRPVSFVEEAHTVQRDPYSRDGGWFRAIS